MHTHYIAFYFLVPSKNILIWGKMKKKQKFVRWAKTINIKEIHRKPRINMWGKMTQARKNWSNKKDFRYHCSCERFSIKKKEKL